MVAGSPTKRMQGQAGRILPLSIQCHLAWSRGRELSQVATWQGFLALYVLASLALLLPQPFGSHPGWAYNWEGYTAWRWITYWEPPTGPTWEILAPTDGLMTDSGQGPLVGIPVALGVTLAGVTLEAMRIPVALLAALGPPLLWLCGRRSVGEGPAVLAAMLLAFSPAFLFYGRTATLVGVSLAPLLLSTLALVSVLDAPGHGARAWLRSVALAGSLLLGIFAYAPVRLLWPATLLILGVTAFCDVRRRRYLALTALGCLITVPAGVMALEQVTAPEPQPLAAAFAYFHARGEQLVAMSEDASAAEQYVRDFASERAEATDAGRTAARQLIAQNAVDLGRLLLDRDTRPIGNDYWNEQGRFWPWFLLPFAAIGVVFAFSRKWHPGPEMVMTLLPLILGMALALPLLLTSRVHVGRLLPVLPFALLLAASGLWVAGRWLSGLAPRRNVGSRGAMPWAVPLLASGLLVAMMASARAELNMPVATTREARTAATLAVWAEQMRERGGAVLVEDPGLGDEIEQVHAATYRIELSDTMRFVDLTANTRPQEPGSAPVIYWRNALGALAAGAIPGPCDRLWFVAPETVETFFSIWKSSGCIGPPDTVILP